jgi:hypothetical protein
MQQTPTQFDTATTESGFFLPLDVMAELRVEGFVHAFPNITLQTLTAHVQANFAWAMALPRVQLKMIELVMAASGQMPA